MDKEALVHFVGGAIGGTAGSAITCPLEVIKTRLQSSTYRSDEPLKRTNSKVPFAAKSQSSTSSGGSLKFQATKFKSVYNELIHSIRHSTHVQQNGFLRLPYAQLTLAVRAKSTLSSSHQQSKRSLIKFLAEILRTEGLAALYKGLLPNLVGVAPSKAVYFYTYSTCKRFFNQSELLPPNTAITHMCSAGFGGFVTSTVINPVWLVKTRLQLHQGPLSIRNCIRKIYRNDGLRGFYRGVTASYIGISETIIQFVLYEQIRNIVDDIEFSHENTRFANFMLAGAVAKFCACIATYPHEVVRTRLREENSKAKGFFRTLLQLWREGGIPLLYRGLSVQLLRSVPNTAITMGTYEVVVYVLHAYV
ncbi:Carrier protein [Aphelenchoides besseyi]|nr:Carrier protein [Aphelenchoides besseyi]